LFAWIDLRWSTHRKTPTLGILDRNSSGAWPDRSPVGCSTVLFTLKFFMNRFVLLSVLVAVPFTLVAGTLQTVTLELKNMTCSVCPITVKKALEKVPGVTSATVDFDKKSASVTFDPDKASPATLTKATSDAGYPSTLHN
jgi:mercuric ion binding protein